METRSGAPQERRRALVTAATAVLCLTCAIVILCVVEAAGVAAPPHSNVRFSDGAAEVYAVAPGDLYDEAGVETGDRIITLNGTVFESSHEYTAFLRSIRPGDRLVIEIDRKGHRIVLEATAKSNLKPSRLIAVAVPVAALLLTGAAVFFAAPKSGTTFLFLLYCTSTAVNDACQLPLLGGRSAIQIAIITAYTLFSIQSPAIGLNLFVLFPARSRAQKLLTWWLFPAYCIQTFLGLSYLLPALSDVWASRMTTLGLHPVLLGLFNSNVVICSALSAFSLAAVVVSTHPERVRQQARLLFFGFALLAVLQLALYTLPLRLTGRMMVSAETYMLLDLIVPASVAAAVLLHRLWNIDVLVRQGFIYGTASAFVAVAFLVAVAATSWLAHLVWDKPDAIVLAAAAASSALLFAPVQRKTRHWVDRHLYRKPLRYEKVIADVAEQLAVVLDLKAIAMLLSTRLGAALEPESVALASFDPSPPRIVRIDPDRAPSVLCEGADAEHAAAVLHDRLRPFEPSRTEDRGFSDVALVAPVIRAGHVLGAILLGPRRSGIAYLPDDHELLAGIARETAPVMDNARLLRERSEHEKLAMVGTATAAIAHELKNPLAAIKSTAAILRRRLPDDARGQELSDVIVDEVDRLEQSVLEVLTFARPHRARSEPVAVAALVTQLARVVQPDLEQCGIWVRLDLEEAEQPLHCDAEGLRQTLLNIVINAREAMTSGGEVHIRLRPWVDSNRTTLGIEIRVADTGPGFPKDMINRIFEPFVSGKRLGTGLGLANVQRFVSDHGGEVLAENRNVGGAVITIRLPFRAQRTRREQDEGPGGA